MPWSFEPGLPNAIHCAGRRRNLCWRRAHSYARLRRALARADGNGTCAQLKWAQCEGPTFQLHFVEQFRKYEGDGLTVAGIELYLEQLHGDMSEPDAYMHNRIGFAVPDVDPFVAKLQSARVPYRVLGRDSIVQFMLPGGIVVELAEAEAATPSETVAAGEATASSV